MRLDIRKMTSIKIGQEIVGFRTKVKVVKNKVAPPFRETEFDIIFGEGISREGDILDLAVENGIVEKSGAWYSYKGERVGQGRDNSRIFLKENKDLLKQLEDEVREKIGLRRLRVEEGMPKEAPPQEKAKQRAFRLLAMRARSEKELRAKLKEKGFRRIRSGGSRSKAPGTQLSR